MKNQIIAGIILLLLSKNTFSQNSTDSIITKKNEIGIDLIPFIKVLSNVNKTSSFQASILYKRKISKKLYFRFGIKTNSFTNRTQYNDIYYSPLDNTNNIINYNKTIKTPETQLNTGIEYRWGKKKLKFFTGLDLGYSYSKETYSEYTGLRTNNVGYYPSGLTVNANDSVIRSFSTVRNGINITPFIGIQYHFSKRFFFSTQFGIPFQYIMGNRTPIKNDLNYRPSKFNEIGISSGLLNNFSIFYKF
jgi:hypothetical protein